MIVGEAAALYFHIIVSLVLALTLTWFTITLKTRIELALVEKSQ